MSLITTLPGDMPGLLRNGSILRHNGRLAVALQVIEGFVLVAHHASGTDEETEVEGGTVPWDLVALDLTDPTGRVHVAWWVEQHRRASGVTSIELEIAWSAEKGADMTPEQIDTLARLVLRLAGRETP